MSKYIYSFLVFALSSSLLACNAYKVRKGYQKGKAQPQQFYETVSFETYNNWMVLEVRLNDHEEPFRFLYDTGAPNVVTPQTVEKLGLKSFAKRNVGDSQGRSSKLEFVNLDAVHIGNVTFEQTSAVVTALDAVPELECPGFDGFIGANLMKLAKWEIDYEAKKMIFTNDRSKLSALEDGFKIPFTTSQQYSPYTKVTLLDSVEQRFKIDTGKDGDIDIRSAAFHSKLDSFFTFPHYTIFGRSGAGIYGATQDTFHVVYLDSIRLGDLTIHDQAFLVEKRTPNLLGMGILKNYHLLLDWDKKEAILEPFQPDSNQNEVKKESFGFQLSLKNQQLEVVSLVRNSPAEVAGIKIGDQIIQIDQTAYQQLRLQDYCDFGTVRDLERDSISLKVKRADQIFERKLYKEDVVQQPKLKQ
ncbi:MAG: aspartyl protease family protein [Bacteroidota bacterium]